MNKEKSPFLIIPQFFSPLMCDDIITQSTLLSEEDGLCVLKTQIDLTTLLSEKITDILPDIVDLYDITPTDLITPVLYKLKENAKLAPSCDNSKHLNNKWVQIYPRDISGYIALSDYNSNIPFDTNFEVYGGKLEFPQHAFGFNPQIGTLIIYPSAPHFIHKHTPILCGELYYIQFFIKAETPYLHDPTKFPGDYTTWFREIT